MSKPNWTYIGNLIKLRANRFCSLFSKLLHLVFLSFTYVSTLFTCFFAFWWTATGDWLSGLAAAIVAALLMFIHIHLER